MKLSEFYNVNMQTGLILKKFLKPGTLTNKELLAQKMFIRC